MFHTTLQPVTKMGIKALKVKKYSRNQAYTIALSHHRKLLTKKCTKPGNPHKDPYSPHIKPGFHMMPPPSHTLDNSSKMSSISSSQCPNLPTSIFSRTQLACQFYFHMLHLIILESSNLKSPTKQLQQFYMPSQH